MPRLDRTGPEGQGPKTGRKLGRCKKTEEEQENAQLGRGQGKQRRGGCGDGRGRRLNSNRP
jgi:hypothetical protein